MELDSGDKLLLQAAQLKLNAANEIMRFLADHFRDKYGLTPENQITPDGRVITVSALDGTQRLPLEVGE